MILHLLRQQDDTNQTLGKLSLKDVRGQVLFSCVTLELPWEHNLSQKSCIPCGFYQLKKRYSLKYGWHLHVQNVEGRSLILIHYGNFRTDTKGCILVGRYFKDLNSDKLPDVTDSRLTMKTIMSFIEPLIYLKIENGKNIWKI
jgi:hypothetical protein